MVTIRVYGVLRLDSGVKMLEAEAENVQDVFRLVFEESKRIKPDSGITMKDVKGCMVVVNGKMVKPNAKLNHGDEIMLVPASGGG